jgi:hypothetical protein
VVESSVPKVEVAVIATATIVVRTVNVEVGNAMQVEFEVASEGRGEATSAVDSSYSWRVRGICWEVALLI